MDRMAEIASHEVQGVAYRWLCQWRGVGMSITTCGTCSSDETA